MIYFVALLFCGFFLPIDITFKISGDIKWMIYVYQFVIFWDVIMSFVTEKYIERFCSIKEKIKSYSQQLFLLDLI